MAAAFAATFLIPASAFAAHVHAHNNVHVNKNVHVDRNVHVNRNVHVTTNNLVVGRVTTTVAFGTAPDGATGMVSGTPMALARAGR